MTQPAAASRAVQQQRRRRSSQYTEQLLALLSDALLPGHYGTRVGSPAAPCYLCRGVS
jgi:hypothetical protein